MKENEYINKKTVLEKMKDIVNEIPLCSEYETDARDRWPQRWSALEDYLNREPDFLAPDFGKFLTHELS